MPSWAAGGVSLFSWGCFDVIILWPWAPQVGERALKKEERASWDRLSLAQKKKQRRDTIGLQGGKSGGR